MFQWYRRRCLHLLRRLLHKLLALERAMVNGHSSGLGPGAPLAVGACLAATSLLNMEFTYTMVLAAPRKTVLTLGVPVGEVMVPASSHVRGMGEYWWRMMTASGG